MAAVKRAPGPWLRPFVRTLWYSDDDGGPAAGTERREHVLPTGSAHIVIRVAGPALRLHAGPGDPVGRSVGTAVVGGPRATYYVRDVSRPVCSVGAELLPGAVPLLLGLPADGIAGRHAPLEDFWGREAREAQERLALARSREARLALFESLLVARLPRLRGLHPAIAEALHNFGPHADVRALVARSGYSHRRFVALFREAVGLSPKRYSRVLRFRSALRRVAARCAPPGGSARVPPRSWAGLALEAGYSDQSHFHREFREFAGLTPGRYEALAPASPHHVPIRG